MAALADRRQTRSMNETTPPPGDAPHPASHPPFGSGFFSWIRDLGISRSEDRWFAGVAGGIAAKAGIDPLIVRGVFVVLALLGGPGVLLYLAGWLLLPGSDGRIHLEEMLRGRSSAGMTTATIIIGAVIVISAFTGLFVAGAPLFSAPGFWLFGNWGAFGFPAWISTTATVLFWIAAAVAVAFLVRRTIVQRGRETQARAQSEARTEAQRDGDADRGTPGPAASAGAASAGPSASAGPGSGTGAGADDWQARAAEWGRKTGERANRWSEEAGRQADAWSARYAEHHDAHRLGAVHTLLTLALALLAAGAAAAWALGAAAANGAVLTSAVLGAVAVLAVSLIIAGIRGRHTGGIGFLAFCGVVALLFTAVLPLGSRFQAFGTMRVGTDAPGAVLLAGSSRIDLSGFDDDELPEDIVVWQLFGSSTVTLPDEASVAVKVRVLAGTAADPDGAHAAGPLVERTVVEHARNAAAADRTVTVYMLAGSVRVERSPRAASDTRAESEQQRLQERLDRTREELEDLEKEMAR